MCGIAGIFNLGSSNKISKKIISEMTVSLSHRGPDSMGCMIIRADNLESIDFIEDYDDTNIDCLIALGHRRLSIIDLTRDGHQPFYDPEKRYVIVFNGEIYNFIELREELIELKYKFQTKTDTEVLLQAYIAWGVNVFKKLNGMWSIAIYDKKKGELVLSRDRFGKKPLYYFLNENFIVFASEPKALFKHPLIEKIPNVLKVAKYAGMNYRQIDGDTATFYENIHTLPAGSYWKLKPASKTKPVKFYQVEIKKQRDIVLADAITEFNSLLENAVKIRMRSDVPVGIMLSGGLDSTSITYYAKNNQKNIKTYSGITGEGYYNESVYIDEMVNTFKLEHQYIRPAEKNLENTLREMIYFHDEPICTVSWFSFYEITKIIAADGIKVVLTGHGGDELLAGYWDHYHYHWFDLMKMGSEEEYEISCWVDNHKRSIDEKNLMRDYIKKLKLNRLIEIEKYSEYIEATCKNVVDHSVDFKNFEYKFAPIGELDRRLYLELIKETVPAVLKAEDRNMMANSMENRCPFLDYRLVNFCYSLHSNLKIKNGIGKYLLRESMRGKLPENIRNRKDKTGHNAPSGDWWRGEQKKLIEKFLNKKGYINEEIYALNKVKDLFTRHLLGENHAMFFWQYINLNIWYEEIFEIT